MATDSVTTTTGLQISPARQELRADPGGTAKAAVIIANQTKQNLDVTLFFREFTVVNTDYDYAFDVSRYNWIKIDQPNLTLKPGESQTVDYSLTPNNDASPGGYYFTIFASSNLKTNGVNTTIQATSQLYTTVSGKLDKGTRLDKVTLPSILISPDISYSFQMTNTGNVYYTIYSVASLSNVFTDTKGETAAHVVLPDKPREMTGSLPAPAYPGIYTATIGYKTDSGNLLTESKPVLYIPLWGVVIAIGILLVLLRVTMVLIRRRYKRRSYR